MNYIDGTVDAPMDAQESQDEAAAAHQMDLDILYSIGCEFSIPDNRMRELCQIANISFDELQNHSTNSTESTPCQSQQCYSGSLVQAKQPAYVI